MQLKMIIICENKTTQFHLYHLFYHQICSYITSKIIFFLSHLNHLYRNLIMDFSNDEKFIEMNKAEHFEFIISFF